MRIPLFLTLTVGAAAVWLWQPRPAAPEAVAPLPALPQPAPRSPEVRVEGYPAHSDLVLHPLWAEGDHAQRLSRLIWPGLVRPGPGGQPEPVLAAGWRGDAGGRRWVVEVRDGVRWSDGTPLTARDVVFTYAALREPGYNGPLAGTFADVLRVEAAGELAVRFTLRRADPHFPERLSPGLLPMHAVVSTRAAANPQLDLRRAPAAGPYRLGGVAEGGTVTLVPNAAAPAPGRWGRLVLRPLASPAAVAGALARGEVDAVCLGGAPVPWAQAAAVAPGVVADPLDAPVPPDPAADVRRGLPPGWGARRAGAPAPDCSA